MSDKLWIISSILIILGGIMIPTGAVIKYYAEKKEKYKGHADAKVVEIRIIPREGEASFSQFRNSQIAFFEFIADGKLIKVRDKTETYPCPYRMGQKVKLVYDLKNPEIYEMDPGNIQKMWGMICSSVGVGSVITGCILFLVHASVLH